MGSGGFYALLAPKCSAHHSSKPVVSNPPTACIKSSVSRVDSWQFFGRETAAAPVGSSASGVMCGIGRPSSLENTRQISYLVYGSGAE